MVPLETKTYAANPKHLSLLKRNARYMTGAQMRQLTDNIKRDGTLTSAPLVYRVGEDLVVLSGNHRVQASIKAGLEHITVMEILTPLSEEHRVALQLSHNAISGQDDPNLLLELYESLSLDEKLYSGISDDLFKIEELDFSSLSIGPPKYEEITLLFLPADAEAFKALVKKLQQKSRPSTILLAHLEQFDAVFNTVIAIKEHLNVYNSALAFAKMSELAMECLEQLQSEQTHE